MFRPPAAFDVAAQSGHHVFQQRDRSSKRRRRLGVEILFRHHRRVQTKPLRGVDDDGAKEAAFFRVRADVVLFDGGGIDLAADDDAGAGKVAGAIRVRLQQIRDGLFRESFDDRSRC